MKNEDAQLINRFLAGDERAFTALVKKYQKSVHALAWRKVGDFHTAEELTQDTFLKVYQKLGTLKNPNQFAGWLYVTADRVCIAWYRKQKPKMESLEPQVKRKLTRHLTTTMKTSSVRKPLLNSVVDSLKIFLSNYPKANARL